MGRPRKLRPEDASSVTASPEIEGGSLTTTLDRKISIDELQIQEVKKTKSFIPYRGKDQVLEIGVPYLFVNGRKIICVMRKQKGTDDKGNPIYTIKRNLYRTLYPEKRESILLRENLRKLGIPGA